MTTYNTGNPVPSADARDRYDNSQVFDEFATGSSLATPDRMGVSRKTLHGMETEFNSNMSSWSTEFDASMLERETEFDGRLLTWQGEFETLIASSGYIDIGDYAAGKVITSRNQVFRKDFELYHAGPGLSLPYTLTGVWGTEGPSFTAVGDAVLRAALANMLDPAQGAAMIGRGQQVVTTFAQLRALKKTSPSKYVVVEGAGFVSFYVRDDADTTTVETIPTVMVATDGARYKLNHNGVITALQCGLFNDGVTLNTSAMLNGANAAVTAQLAVLFWNKGTFLGESVTIIPDQNWQGASATSTILKAKASLNATMVSSNFTVNTDRVTIKNMQFHGNRANNTSGDLMAIKGAKMDFKGLIFTEAAGNGLTTDFDTDAGFGIGFPLGFESSFTDIVFDTIGQHGWVYNGPTDSAMTNITFLDCGVKTNATYYGLYATKNFRGDNLHPWNRATTTNVPAASVFIDTPASACTVVNSHFEGGLCPLKVLANGCTFVASDYYAPRGIYCIENYGIANQFHGVIGGAAYHLNPTYKGVLCEGGNSRFDLTDIGAFAGSIEFAGSQGGNSVVMLGWRASGPLIGGTPHVNDDVFVHLGGGGGGTYRKRIQIPPTVTTTGVTSGTGAFTTANATIDVLRDGKYIDWGISIAITALGTAGGDIKATMPFTSTRTRCAIGFENLTGKAVRMSMQAGDTQMRIVGLDNTFVGATNMTIAGNGRWEFT